MEYISEITTSYWPKTDNLCYYLYLAISFAAEHDKYLSFKARLSLFSHQHYLACQQLFSKQSSLRLLNLQYFDANVPMFSSYDTAFLFVVTNSLFRKSLGIKGEMKFVIVQDLRSAVVERARTLDEAR